VRRWLWTWGGRCFGYRRGDSLFTFDGIEVGRFVDMEVYGIEGGYLGELKRTEDGDRLITSNYKRSRSIAPFATARDRPQPRPEDRPAYPMYCGYEDFPAPEAIKTTVSTNKSIGRRPSRANTIQ